MTNRNNALFACCAVPGWVHLPLLLGDAVGEPRPGLGLPRTRDPHEARLSGVQGQYRHWL